MELVLNRTQNLETFHNICRQTKVIFKKWQMSYNLILFYLQLKGQVFVCLVAHNSYSNIFTSSETFWGEHKPNHTGKHLKVFKNSYL